jgi:hypothetical protein
MQANFDAANNPKLIANVQREVRSAMARNKAIIFLEYEGLEYDLTPLAKTHEELTKIVAGYKNTYTIGKSENDGSREVRKATCALEIYPTTLTLVGVNKGACVAETATGLAFIYSDVPINIIEEACGCHDCHDCRPDCCGWFDVLPNIPNVNLYQNSASNVCMIST